MHMNKLVPGTIDAMARRARIALIILSFITMLFSCQRNTRADVAAPAPEDPMLGIFRSTPQEDLQQTRWDIGNTIISNEARLELFHPHIKDIGGGYVGVGGTQNFLLAAWADSEWVWLMDFTGRVVAANKLHIAFLKNAPTPGEFRKLWSVKSRKEATKIINGEYGQSPDLTYYHKTWDIGRQYIPWRFGTLDRLVRKRNYKIWLNDQDLYQRMRNLALKGRINPVRGNLNGDVTVKGIADTAKRMSVPVRIMYFSNAEEYMKAYSPSFIANFSSLPVDEKSKVLRTISVYRRILPWSPDSELCSDKGFHYSVMPAGIFQSWLVNTNRKFNVVDILKTGEINREDGISVVSKMPAPQEKTPENKDTGRK